MKRLETDKNKVRWVFFDKCAFSNLGCHFCYKEEFSPPIHSVRSTFALLERDSSDCKNVLFMIAPNPAHLGNNKVLYL